MMSRLNDNRQTSGVIHADVHKGNQLCIDLDPGPRGVVGQMVWWETRAGPYPHGADSLLALLRAHWKHLSSGKYDAPEAWEMAGCGELTEVEPA